jgi:hypothetical protein
MPTLRDEACHAVTATSASETTTSATIPSQSLRRRAVSSRSSSDGLMNLTCSSGTTENSSETRTPIAIPCKAALQVTP